jgi:predicted DNA-binding transcriptional regulator AlpA
MPDTCGSARPKGWAVPTDIELSPATAAPEPPPLLLSQPRAWRFLGVSRTAWFRLKSEPGFPKPVRVNGSLYWRTSELSKWAERLRPARGKQSPTA